MKYKESHVDFRQSLEMFSRSILGLKNQLPAVRVFSSLHLTKHSVIIPVLIKNCNLVCRIEAPVSFHKEQIFVIYSKLYSSGASQTELIDYNTFDKVCEETLESLSEYVEELCENSDSFQSADVSYSSGVLTVNLGDKYGTYVINRQSPNRQIWLSSPSSGPKRYDLVSPGLYWVYKHDGQTLHQLLQQEFSQIVGSSVDFSKCAYSKL